MNTQSLLARSASVALLACCLTACNTLTNNSTGDANVLAGKKTFTVATPTGGRDILTQPGGGASAAAVAAISAVLKAQGYEPVAAAPADLAVVSYWSYSVGPTPTYNINQPGQSPTEGDNLNSVGLDISVNDGASGKLLWRGWSAFPMQRNQISPGGAETLVRSALQQVPAAKAADAAAPAAVAK